MRLWRNPWNPSMSFDTFIATAWTDHADHPEEVATRLAGSLAMLQSSADIPAFARIVTHVYGEHLARWTAGVELLEALRNLPLPAGDGSEAAASAVTRGIAVLRYAGSLDDSLPQLAREDRIAVLAVASSALLGQREFERSIAAYNEALNLAEQGLPASSPALRSLAIGGNNLAAGLEEKVDRDDLETRGMVAAAEAGLKYWRLAGTWLEEERAEYRLARSLLQAANPAAAVNHARRCIEVCSANEASPLERFFGYAALAIAQKRSGDEPAFAVSRGEALLFFEQVPSEERRWCESELNELGG
jgi:tetratricopeptide (TPR) repeat protein